VLLLSLRVFAGPVADTFEGPPEGPCVLPPPVSRRFVNASTSIICLFASCFGVVDAVSTTCDFPSRGLLANLLNVFCTALSEVVGTSTRGGLDVAMFSLVFLRASETTVSSSSSPELSAATKGSPAGVCGLALNVYGTTVSCGLGLSLVKSGELG
jgi:hypothetical protein